MGISVEGYKEDALSASVKHKKVTLICICIVI